MRTTRDWEDEQERHARRMKLMRMQGEINRAEKRNYTVLAVAVIVLLVALIMGT